MLSRSRFMYLLFILRIWKYSGRKRKGRSYRYLVAPCSLPGGGIGTCARAISAGTPQLVVPASFDQPDNADRLCAMGVAAQIPMSKFTARRAERVAKVMRGLVSAPKHEELRRQGSVEGRGRQHGSTKERGVGVGARCAQLAQQIRRNSPGQSGPSSCSIGGGLEEAADHVFAMLSTGLDDESSY